VHGHARLRLDHVLPEELLVDKVRAVGIVGRQDAARVGGKELLGRRVRAKVDGARLVVVDGGPLLERRVVSAVDE
jgi:hypothetical protein